MSLDTTRGCSAQGDATPAPTLLDLPEEVLALCLSLGLTEPCDIASAAMAAPRLRDVCRQAPLRVCLAAGQQERTLTATEQQARLQANLASLCRSFPGTAELDLRGQVVEDGDIERLLAALPRLSSLQLSACKKLSPGVASALAGRRAASLRTLTLQRCYQQRPSALTQLLRASGPQGIGLSALAISHLALRDWPAACAAPPSTVVRAAEAGTQPSARGTAFPPAVTPAIAPPLGRGLRALALHNCSWLTPAGLQAIAESCPNLEALFLGGSSILPDDPAAAKEAAQASIPPSRLAEAVAAALTGLEEGATAAAAARPAAGAPSLVRAQQAQQAQQAPAAAPPMAAGEAWAPAGGGGDALRLRSAARAALGRLISSGAVPGALVCGYLADVATELAVLAARLPRLALLELTFGPPGAANLLRLLMEEEALAGGRQAPLQVLDFCQRGSVDQAHAWQQGITAAYYAADSAARAAGMLTPSDASVLLHAGVNCSSGGRHTPLHAAAEEGDLQRVEALLALGGQLDARDKSCCTPLFSACEAGHARVVARLLEAGADATIRNSAGEAPLYIAALRGHIAVVDLLLEHCQHSGVRWQEPRLYGDGWTPLHAAAVGGRTAIVELLLAAAGDAAPQLVASPNRYGQTPIHVAARKGSPLLLHALVAAGGAASLAAADCDGKTAAEIARRNGNGQAWRLLSDAHLAASTRHEQQRLHRGTKPTVERPRSAEQPRGQAGSWVGRRLQQRKAAQSGRC